MYDGDERLVVLHILGPLRPSGMERMLVSASAHFLEQNITSIVLGQGAENTFAGELRSAGYEVIVVGAVASSLRDAFAVRKLVREKKVDVIHIHTEGNYLRTALTMRWAVGRKGKVVRTIHNVFGSTGMWKLSRTVQALLADGLLDALIAPSPDVALNEKKLGRRAEVIYNWVDDRLMRLGEQRDEWAAKEEKAPIALIIGNCSEIKNHELALEGLISTSHRLIHLGDETNASAEELKLLRDLQDSNRIVSRGIHPPDEALLQAQYFLMSSRHEGMSVALAEALIARLPAFVSDAPGLQWAKGLSGVKSLPDSAIAWKDAMESWSPDSGRESVTVDFSAGRGAREYAGVYRAEARQRTRVEHSKRGSNAN